MVDLKVSDSDGTSRHSLFLSTGDLVAIIAGSLLGGILVISLIVFLIILCYRWRKLKGNVPITREPVGPTEDQTGSDTKTSTESSCQKCQEMKDEPWRVQLPNEKSVPRPYVKAPNVSYQATNTAFVPSTPPLGRTTVHENWQRGPTTTLLDKNSGYWPEQPQNNLRSNYGTSRVKASLDSFPDTESASGWDTSFNSDNTVDNVVRRRSPGVSYYLSPEQLTTRSHTPLYPYPYLREGIDNPVFEDDRSMSRASDSFVFPFIPEVHRSYQDLYSQTNLPKPQRHRMRNDTAAAIAAQKHRVTSVCSDTDSLVTTDSVVVYDERTVL